MHQRSAMNSSLPKTRSDATQKGFGKDAFGKSFYFRRRPKRLLCFALLIFIIYIAFRSGRREEQTINYVVVFDAGSTGSRVHVYCFARIKDKSLILLKDHFHQLKPGLSDYAGRPQEAADSLKPLLAAALAAVPVGEQASTRCELRATAGLRLLKGNQAEQIIEAVYKLLKASPFVIGPNDVSILDGQEEGAFAWLTLNYLLGKLGAEYEETVASIDLGGGSVQKAYALPSQFTSPLDGYVLELNGAGILYSVYVKSYLNFGLMAARAEIIKIAGKYENTCVRMNEEFDYKYGDQYYKSKGSNITSYDLCSNLVTKALQLHSTCHAPQRECSFNGIWDGPGVTTKQKLYLFSYIWDRALDSGLITDTSAYDTKIDMDSFRKKSQKVCSLSIDDLKKDYPRMAEDDLIFFCMDMTYINVMLVNGLKVSKKGEVNLVKKLKYNGLPFETTWTLGAAINSLGKV